jgi:hypothetical protein
MIALLMKSLSIFVLRPNAVDSLLLRAMQQPAGITSLEVMAALTGRHM